MKSCIYNTSPEWAAFLKSQAIRDNVNFWRRDKRKLHLKAGASFYFKEIRTQTVIGRARFRENLSLPIPEAWVRFGHANGCVTEAEFMRRLADEFGQDGARLNSVALRSLVELKKRGDGTGPVIRNVGGEALQGSRHWFEKAIMAAKIIEFRWHDIRHTFASRLAMANVGLRAIQEALGHKSIAMTVRYSHLAPDFMADVVEKLVPRESTVVSAEPTDTRTDTGRNRRSTDRPENVH